MVTESSWSSPVLELGRRFGEDAVLASIVERDLPGGPLCTYRVGGPVALFVPVESVDVLERVRDSLAMVGPVPTLVVGRGSNLLIADEGFDGVVLQLGESFAEITVPDVGDAESAGAGTVSEAGTVSVIAGGAALLPVVARRTAAAGLTGFEWAVGVPGSVGGAVRMNAGGHGSDMAASLVRVSVFDLLDGGPTDVEASELGLGYRTSTVGQTQIVLFAELALALGDADASLAELSEIVKWRRENQPGGQNAGSVFANPEGDSAGRLIEAAGLKGFRLGTAEVSTKHANFIQADPDGSASDVIRLIRHIQSVIADNDGIALRTENLLVGRLGSDLASNGGVLS